MKHHKIACGAMSCSSYGVSDENTQNYNKFEYLSTLQLYTTIIKTYKLDKILYSDLFGKPTTKFGAIVVFNKRTKKWRKIHDNRHRNTKN